MRIHLITIITLITFVQVSGRASGQQVTLSLKDAPLETAFKAIERQTQYVFFFPSRVVKDKKPVTLELKQADFRTAMERILEGQGLTYLLSENSVIIKEAGQRGGVMDFIVVKGKVLDSKGRPVPGATVKVKDTQIGTITDIEGRFKLDVPGASAVLIISSVGYLTIQKSVNGQSNMEIRLVENAAQLKEVTVLPVNTGYESIKPERYVGSVVNLDSAILNRAIGKDLLSRLDGITSGLLFVKSSGTENLQLRGTSTLNSNYDGEGKLRSGVNPLIILDDFPFPGNLSNINPNDIESISVLKDAAATSIWGARAGNGVIVITSKKYRKNNTVAIHFSTNLQVQTKPDPSYLQQLGNEDFIGVERMLFDKGFYNSSLSSLYGFTVVQSPVVELLEQHRKGSISAGELERSIAELKKTDINEQYKKHIYREGINVQNYLSVNGGTSKFGYTVSFGADNGKSGIKGRGGSDRYSLNSVVYFTPVPAIELTSNFNYVNEVQRQDNLGFFIDPGGRKSTMYPYAKFVAEDGTHLPVPYKYRLQYMDTVGGGQLLDWRYRPADELYAAKKSTVIDFFRLNTGLKVKLSSWINLDVKHQFSSQQLNMRNIFDLKTFYARDLINSFTAPNTFEKSIPVGGIVDESNIKLLGHNLRTQVNVNQTWNNHSLTAIVAGEISETEIRRNGNRNYGYNEDVITSPPNLNYGVAQPQYIGGFATIPTFNPQSLRNERFVSVLGNINYSYQNKYAFYASARRDGANLLGVNTNNRWKPLWSVGGRWNISEEKFYRVGWLPTMTARFTYGYSGNVSNSVSPLSVLQYSSYPNLWNQNYATITTAPNPDLRWEQVATTNLGLDLVALKGRISLSADFYQKRSKDVISAVDIDPTNGAPTGTVDKNSANLSVKGYDIVLNTHNIEGKFSWTTTMNYSRAKSIAEKVYFTSVNMPTFPVNREGYPIGALFAYKWGGLDPANGNPIGFVGGKESTDYRAIIADSMHHQSYVGGVIPKGFGNVMNTFRYEGFTFSFNISFRSGYYFRKPTIRYASLYGNWLSHLDFQKRWQKAGDESTTNVPSMNFPADVDRDDFFRFSEVNVEKGDHIRLQDLQLSYDFKRLLKSKWIKSMQANFYAGSLNVLIWSKTKSGYDPDFSTSGLLPSKTYSIGLRFGL